MTERKGKQTRKEIHPDDRKVMEQIQKMVGHQKKIEQLPLGQIRQYTWGYALNQGGRVVALSLHRCKFTDLAPLATLTGLTKLNLGNNQISDLSPLSALTGLTKLNLSINQITDLAPLAGLTGLTELDLSTNEFTDLAPLAPLSGLTKLDLYGNQITDLSPLSALTGLTVLQFGDNKITDLAPLAALTGLNVLNLYDNQITDLSPLSTLTELKELILGNNQITDLAPLGGLGKLQRLDVERNRVRKLPRPLLELDIGIAWKNKPGIAGINLFDNPLEEPPQEVVKQGKDAVLNYFKKLEVDDMVPCTCPGCTQSNQPYFYSCKVLTNYQQKGIRQVPCEHHAVMVEVDQLLGIMASPKDIETIKGGDKDLFVQPPPPGPVKKNKPRRTKVFISYCRKDMEWLERVKTNLRVLKLEGMQIDVWDDNRIKAGQKWRDEIKGALRETKIAILLISTDFLASDFIVNDELPPLLAAAEEEGAKILPLVLKTCRFSKNPRLSQFQTVNDPKLPLSKLSEDDQEEVLVKLSDAVEDYLNRDA